MGGLTPPNEPSPKAVFPPPREGWPKGKYDIALWGKPKRATPRGGVSGAIPPQMAPLISGLLGFAGGYSLVAIVPVFTDLFGLSWAIYS